MLFADRLTLDAPRRTRDGYMVARAKAARSGIYEYQGREIDPQGTKFAADQIVRVWRPEEEVFARDSVASFLMKPITNDHPSQPVTADNWRDHAKGIVGQALREGDFLAFDLVLMDRDVIAAVESGKRELSNGYSSDLIFEDGTTPDGERFNAVQRNIRGNHVALVDKGRAGPFCRIGDAAPCASAAADFMAAWLSDERTYNADGGGDKTATARRETSNSGGSHVATKTITFDGLPLEVTDAAEAAITKLQSQITKLTADKDAAETKVGELTASVSTKDGEIAGLNQKLKDAEIGPDKLQQLVADRAALIADAKKVDPKVVTDGKTDAEIRQAVVSVKLGDAAKDMDDNAVSGAFKALVGSIGDAKPDALRKAIGDTSTAVTDTATIRNAARNSRYANA